MEQLYPIPDQDYTVLIVSYTYNQENYIEETLKGFVMQKTNFPFVALVIDDASTDKTADVIRKYEAKYPHVIKGIYLKENYYSKGKSKEPYINPWRDRCKYEAICEGDDYWIDPLKLQKQVDFMEANPEYGIVRTNVHSFIQKDNKIEENFFSHGKWKNIKDNYYDYIIYGWFAAPCTWLYRSKFVVNAALFKEKDCFTGDIALLLSITKDSKIKYIPESTAVYRVLEKSASHFNTFEEQYLFFLKVLNTKSYFAKQTHFFIRFRNWIYNTKVRFYFVLRFCQLNYLSTCFKSTFQDFYRLFIKV